MDKTGKLHLTDMGIDNMTDLVELSDQSLLTNLQTRYAQKIIYTYIGSILISINPYTELGIYETKRIESYQNKALHDMPPHLFGIGEINFSKMILENENQVIVISGESGAGKTESFKRLLKYLAHVSGGSKESKHNNNKFCSEIATKILDSTPLLESFGNAQTIRNDNSSRFGKYVEIFFEDGAISGSRITNYLLEKSRIVNINPKERGYHIFYEVLQGLDSFSKSQYHFKSIKDYNYLNNSISFTLKDRNDVMNLTEFMNQWSTLGLSNDDLDVTMRILSAVLHLGNVKFVEQQDVSSLAEIENIGIVAKMLKVDRDSLKHCLTMKTTETVKDALSSPLSVEQSVNYRDTLAKHLYSELFNWIIVKVNEALNQNNQKMQRRPSVFDKSLNSPTSSFKCIAMLDIYGFENFPENSLEQLCINYANETLQQFFNRYVFELEQAEYKQEGISWHYISYPDNQPIIDLLSAKPNGIIQILNDECSIPQGSDEQFLTKCNNVHSKNNNYEKPKKVHLSQFIIHHFAGSISYSVNGFLEKNRDVLRKEILNVIEHSEVDEISEIFRKKRELQQKNPIAKARTPAVMGDFQNSLTTLLKKMQTCQPWFIRCLKPNNKKEAMIFDKNIVMDQMKYTGILETVKIRKSGFPIRILFSVFLSRFYLLVTKEVRKASKNDPQEACRTMMIKFKGQKGKHFEIGKTKLFLKETFARHLESQVLIIRNRSAIIIQRKWRAYWKIRLIIIQNQAATKIQSVVRGFLDRRRIKNLRSGIIKLQALVRMQLVRRKFLQNHPEFLKYVHTTVKEERDIGNQSKMTVYKNPNAGNSKKPKKHRRRKLPSGYNYDMLKIPIELAHILDKSTGISDQSYYAIAPEQIVLTGHAQHLWNREDYKLPENVDLYLLDNLLDEFGHEIPLESKTKPIAVPYMNINDSSDHIDNALMSHKLILRILHAPSMPWLHRFLTTSYLLFMASKSADLQKEIAIQIIAETIPQKSFKARNDSEYETDRLKRAWNLLGNFLSFIIPVNDFYNYVLKYVSDCFGVDNAITCQEKLLQFASSGFPKIPRLFPPSNLEYRANQSGSKTSVMVSHPDDKSNSVHLNSYTIAEDLASHSLCFRMKRYKLLKGFSISIIFPDKVIDCCGLNYVFDAIAALELPPSWMEVTGCSFEKNFLVSKRYVSNGNAIDLPSRGFIKNVTKNYMAPSSIKPLSSLNSLRSMDSWVEKEFDSSFRHEDTASIPVQDFIHGLEEDIGKPNNTQPRPAMPRNLIGSVSNPNLVMSSNPNIPLAYNYQTYTRPGSSTMYFPATQSELDLTQDPLFLQEQLNAVQLENKVIQSTIERELLQNRLQKLQQHRQMQNAAIISNVPFMYPQPYHHMTPYSNQPVMQPYHYYNPHINQTLPYQNAQTGPPPTNGLIQNQYMNGQDNYQSNHQVLDEHDQGRRTFIPSDHHQYSQTMDNQFHNNNVSPSNYSQSTASSMHTTVVPPVPPPPPPVLSSNSKDRANHEDGNETTLKRNRSVVKYSEIGAPSDTVVDDSTILPVLKADEDRKSYQRAAEVPKVNVTHRAAFLEKFFQEKPMINSNISLTPKKRQAVEIITTEFDEDQQNAINLLASMNSPNKLIPRPIIKTANTPKKVVPAQRKSIINKKEISLIEEAKPIYDTQLPRINLNNNHVNGDVANDSKTQLIRSHIDNPEPLKAPVGKYVASKKAIILSGWPDMRYYTYQKMPWFLMLKREIYLPNEIQNTAALNPMIFCQIVRDLIEFPCIRWVGNEKERIMSILGDTSKLKDIKSILSVPANIMVQVIDETQRCELYFSRFFPIEWIASTPADDTFHWMAISHSGVRFVDQNSRLTNSPLSIAFHVEFANISKVTSKDPDQYNNDQLLIIKTRMRKNFKIKTNKAALAKMLILEFLSQIEMRKSNGTINLTTVHELPTEKGKKKRMLLKENPVFGDSETTILGVNNERIIFQKPNQKTISKIDDRQYPHNMDKKEVNLIEFVHIFSRHKDRRHIENVVLKWQHQPISEPILIFSIDEFAKRALEVHKLLIEMSKDSRIESNYQPIENAFKIFKILKQTTDLIEEVIIQILKQINGNPANESRNYLWNLLSIVIIFVGPTMRMQPFLLEHLNQIVKHTKNQDQYLANFALKSFRQFSKYGSRKENPLDAEFKQLMVGVRDVKLSVTLGNDSTSFQINYYSAIEEVINSICLSIDVTSKNEINEYSLAVVEIDKNNVPINAIDYLKGESYMFDVIDSLTKSNRSNTKFFFVRMSWIMPLNLEYRSQKFIQFMFSQISKDIISGEWLVSSTENLSSDTEFKNVARIAYLNMRAQGIEKPRNDEVFKAILPQRLFNQKKKATARKKVIKMITNEVETMTESQIQQNDFQKKFLEQVEKLPRFGCVRFPVGGIKQIKAGYINFDRTSVFFSEENYQNISLKISIADLTSFVIKSTNPKSTVFVIGYKRNEEIQFSSMNVAEINCLLHQYIKMKSVDPTMKL